MDDHGPMFHITEDGEIIAPTELPDIHRPGAARALRKLIAHALDDLGPTPDGESSAGPEKDPVIERAANGDLIDRSDLCWRCRAYAFREDESGQRRCAVCQSPRKPKRRRGSKAAA